MRTTSRKGHLLFEEKSAPRQNTGDAYAGYLTCFYPSLELSGLRLETANDRWVRDGRRFFSQQFQLLSVSDTLCVRTNVSSTIATTVFV